jgi:undecaprenyl-diphosphatase
MEYTGLYILLLCSSLIGFSLIYVGVHYPLDVIFGAIIGIISALNILKYQERILNNRIAPLIVLKRD